jgi:hypothetical protein
MKNEFDYLNDVKVDFSKYDLEKLTELERMKMINAIAKGKNKFWVKAASIAACLTIVITLNQSVYAQSIINDIVKSISTGFNHFVQVDNANIEIELPKEVKLYDKNGIPLTTYRSGDVAYTKDGELIINVTEYALENFNISLEAEDESGLSVIISDKREDDPVAAGSNENRLIINDEKEIDDYLNFKAKLPAYLPNGYVFYGAELYKNSDGSVSGDYLNIYYKNHASGKSFIVMERMLNDDTAFTLSTDGTIEETKVNGCKAVLVGNSSLDWETGNISVSIAGRDALSRNELFEVAESVK